MTTNKEPSTKPNQEPTEKSRLDYIKSALEEADRRAEDESGMGYVSYEDALKKQLTRLGISDEDVARVESADSEATSIAVETPTDAGESFEIKVQHGPSVELGARALAIANIMKTLNHANKARGATIARQYPNSAFDNRYGILADDIQDMMLRKSDRMLADNEEDFDTLTATDEMKAAGFPADEVDKMKRRLKYDMLNQYGPGRATARDRASLVRKVESTAHAVNRKRKS